jgi:hypothetical protein
MRYAKQIFQFFALKLQAEAKYFGNGEGAKNDRRGDIGAEVSSLSICFA